MPDHATGLMFVPWLRNLTRQLCLWDSSPVPSAPAIIFSIYQEEKQLQNAALQLTSLALIPAKEFSCVGECCGSDEDNMTNTAFCQPRLFSPAQSSGRDPCTEHNLCHGKNIYIFKSLFVWLIVYEHGEQNYWTAWKIYQQLLHSRKASSCLFLKVVDLHGGIIICPVA